MLMELAKEKGISIGGKIEDCGCMVFDNTKQDVHSGGSGCGCSAISLCGYYLEKIRNRELKRILFCGTGALLSPTSSMQGLPIPGVCHAISIIGDKV
jgi:stage V sporulation protein AD